MTQTLVADGDRPNFGRPLMVTDGMAEFRTNWLHEQRRNRSTDSERFLSDPHYGSPRMLVRHTSGFGYGTN
jgi:hypothetical protein